MTRFHKWVLNDLHQWLQATLLAVLVYLITTICLFRGGEVKGGSMEPTYHDGDKVFIISYKLFFRGPQRDEVCVLVDNNNHSVIKRVILVPGDVDIYSPKSNRVLASDEYVVLGDNRNGSSDSREYGPVKLKQFKGVVQ